jgi:dTDP-4-dehydrorhamnose reductase
VRERPILVTGASGLLGTWLRRAAPAGEDVVALAHVRPVAGVRAVTADLRDRAATLAAVASCRPRLVVHAAYARERDAIVAATRHVVEAADLVGAPVLFTSSDTVFLGDGRPRAEDAQPDATWDYGAWKIAAERLVLAGGALGSAVVRLPLLVSVDPDDGIVRPIRAAAAEGRRTRWFTDEVRRPALASEVAAALWRLVALPADRRRGCWHLLGPERLTRYDLACRLAAAVGLPRDVLEPARRPPDGDRPADLELTDARARDEIGWDPSPIPTSPAGWDRATPR